MILRDMVPQNNQELPQEARVYKGRHGAEVTWANLTRQMWGDYTKRFWPIEDELLSKSTYENPAIVGQEIQAGQQQVRSAIDTSVGMRNDAMAGYGVAISADQRKANDRMQSLTTSTSLADAANRIRQNLIDRNRAIAIGASSMAQVQREG